MLTNLLAGVQAGAGAQAARQALYDYMKADEGGKAAVYDKAARQPGKSISTAEGIWGYVSMKENDGYIVLES